MGAAHRKRKAIITSHEAAQYNSCLIKGMPPGTKIISVLPSYFPLFE
jgi:hypothetical protein